ncbi:aspartyl/asparaginyl beta-hydroxylase domain-containing protein [Sphingomonas sp. DT-51]|uniref:aspartyl/asparaginyl beta-hydroxylase domain-containing protein n=1 Tax=Sphingomonas sp. DT-51 TaxID=3396165 RepID=UPI003F5410BA
MDPARLQAMLAAALDARREGRRDEAARGFRAVIDAGVEHPLALNALGVDALARGDEAAARWFTRAIAADPAAPELWMNLARAHRSRGDAAAERAALEGALALDQRHFMALVRLAEWHERDGDSEAAAERWGHVLTMAAALDERTPAIETMLEHARDYVAARRAGFAARIDGALAAVRATLSPAARRRTDACIDHALGRRAIYANQCAGLHFPFLPADEFFAREHFPWLAQIEAETATIRDELLQMLADDGDALRPYVAMKPGTPRNKWSALDGSLAWSALHLWKDGRRDDSVCARVPRTAAAVAALPLSDLPGRTPTVFFSILRPGAHLPAHTGVSNVRSIVHLPLIVPPDCGFRVGGETRAWEEGRAWVFDDTIEHEAWNRSDRPRAILIFDVWNPHIAADERALLRAFYAATAGTPESDLARLGLGE